MTAEKLQTIAENEPMVYEAGKADGIEQGSQEGYTKGYEAGRKAEYDEFWDTYQENGKRQMYQFAFAGGWRDALFKPKYDIILGIGYTGQDMFRNSAIINIKASLANLNIKFDTSKCNYMGNAFQGAQTKELPTIDLSNATYSTSYTFASAYIETIDKIIFSESTKIEASMFNGATGLKNVIFEGVVAKNLDIHWSTLLSKASITSIIDHLSTATSGLTVTLSKKAVDDAFYDETSDTPGFIADRWTDLEASKPNWDIVLVN